MELRGEGEKATEKREGETDRCDVQRFWMLNIACFPLTTYRATDWLLSASTNTRSSILSIIQMSLSFPLSLSLSHFICSFTWMCFCFLAAFGTRMSLYSPIQTGLVLENESQGWADNDTNNMIISLLFSCYG